MKATTLVQKYWWTILGTSFAVLGTSLSASATSLYSITQITAPGVETYNPVKITDNGQVLVNSSTLVDPRNSTYKTSAFVWKGGQTRFLEFPVDSDSFGQPSGYSLFDINEAGTVIGRIGLYDVVSEGVYYFGRYGFSWNGGKINLSGLGYESQDNTPGVHQLNERGQFLAIDYRGSASYDLYLSGEKGSPGQLITPITDGRAYYPAGRAFNNLGQVAVTYRYDLESPESFFWDGGNTTRIGSLGGGDYSTLVQDMNDSAQVVGSSITANGETHAFRWQGGVMEDLGTLGGNSSSAFAINEAGKIIGTSTTANGRSHGFISDNGVMTDLGTLGGTSSFVKEINKGGQVLGCSATSSGGSSLFVWSDGQIQDTGISNCSDRDDPSVSDYTSSFEFNDLGQLVYVDWQGGRIRPGEEPVPPRYFFYDGQNTFSTEDIENLLGENSGWDITAIRGLNNKGQIVGTGLFNGQQSAFVMSPNGEPVPEPSTIIGSVLAIGSLGSAAYRRRKAR
jgi:probable HAF family extracellular repeat protein